MFECVGYAAETSATPLAPWRFKRREPGPDDVRIDIAFCGVCHSDLHTARGEWGNTSFPVIPGHEIVGVVSAVGADVTAFKPGDRVGVGCLVDSCRTCASCRDGLEQYCEAGPTGTYGAFDKHIPGQWTQGGYSKAVVVDQAFVLHIPDALDMAEAAPLLCAGITTYSPLRHWQAGPGKKIGVVGLGGLGHMAVKLAHAMGAEVTLFTTSPGKVEDGKKLGADHVIISTDAAAMAAAAASLDVIIDAVSAEHDINAYLMALKRDGTLVQVGAPSQPLPVQVFGLIMGRRSFAGSAIGGIAETQEMLDFCAAEGVAPVIEMIRMEEIEASYARMLKNDVKYRFVIDMSTLAVV